MDRIARSTRGRFTVPSVLALTLTAGSAAAAWDPAGEPVPVASCASPFTACRDDSRGLFSFWVDNPGGGVTIRGQHRLADGSLATGWAPGGNPVGPAVDGQRGLAAVPDGEGGAWLMAWGRYLGPPDQRIRLWRLGAGGALAPGWPDSGVALGDVGHPKDALLTADGAGGALVGWVELEQYEFRGTNPTLYSLNAVKLVRVAADGAITAGWDAAGNTVFAPVPGGLLSVRRVPTRLIADGNGGAWVAHADSSDGLLDSRLFRMTPAGALAPGFLAEGAPVGPAGAEQWVTAIATDAAGGVYTFGLTVGDPQPEARLGRYAPSGLPAPGWAAGGETLLPGVPGVRGFGSLVADGAGGVVAACGIGSAEAVFRIQRLQGSGSIAPGWALDGVAIEDTIGVPALASLQADASGGAFLVGTRTQHTGSNPPTLNQIVAARVGGDGAFPAGWSSVVTPVTGWNAGNQSMAVGDERGACFVVHDTAVLPPDYAPCEVLAHRLGPDGSSTAQVADAPTSGALLQAFPNPSRQQVGVSISLPASGGTLLEVFDAGGRRVRVLVRERMEAGAHLLQWNGLDDSGRPAPAGVYLLRLQGPGLRQSQRLVRVM